MVFISPSMDLKHYYTTMKKNLLSVFSSKDFSLDLSQKHQHFLLFRGGRRRRKERRKERRYLRYTNKISGNTDTQSFYTLQESPWREEAYQGFSLSPAWVNARLRKKKRESILISYIHPCWKKQKTKQKNWKKKKKSSTTKKKKGTKIYFFSLHIYLIYSIQKIQTKKRRKEKRCVYSSSVRSLVGGVGVVGVGKEGRVWCVGVWVVCVVEKYNDIFHHISPQN